MQEKARIQRQLARMREEGLRDYLEQKLQAIASEEVVNDIIGGFIEEHNCQFLESAAESIMESKQTIKHLREDLDLMKREEQALLVRQREKARQQCKQEHYLQMSALKEELRCIKANLQKEEQRYVVRVEDIRRELQSSLRINQELTEKLEKNKVNMEQMNAAISKFNIQINEKHIKISQLEEKIFQNRTEHIEKQRQQEQEINKNNNQHLNRERQLRQQLQKQAERNMSHLTQQYQVKLNNLVEKVRQMEIQRKNHQEKLARITHQLQRKDLQNRQVVLKNGFIAQSLKKTQIFLQKKQEQCEMLQNEFNSQKQFNKALQLKIQQIQRKNLENNQKQMHLVAQFRDSINHLQKQKEILILEKGYAEQKMAKYVNEYALTISNYEQQMSTIKNNMVQLDKIRKDYEQKLAKEIQLNFMNQEEIKNLLKCNSIQQQEISRLEMKIRTVQEQSKAQIITYQETFVINVQDLQSEVAALKKQNEKLRSEMREMQHELEMQGQTEKYYHNYIQEIAHLKRELAYYQSKPHQLASSKKDKLIEHLPKTISQLSRQNYKLRQAIQNEMSTYQQQFKKLLRLLFTMLQQNELKNARSYNSMQKTRSPQRQQMLMDKTLPRQHPEKPSGMNSIKPNLKEIQQRYQKAHCQNQSFTMRVDSFLNNS